MLTTAPVNGPGRSSRVSCVGGEQPVERLGQAVAAGVDHAVVAEDAVLAGAAVDPVVAGAAVDVVVLAFAEEHVVADHAVDRVVAVLAVDQVGGADRSAPRAPGV